MALRRSWVAESFNTTPRAPNCSASTTCFFSAAEGVEPGMVRHGEIEQKNIWLDLGRQFHCFAAVGSFADYFHIRLSLKQAS